MLEIVKVAQKIGEKNARFLMFFRFVRSCGKTVEKAQRKNLSAF